MKSKQSPEPFLMLFPWGKAAGILFLMGLGVMFVYRLSQTGGPHVNQACLFSVPVATTAGILGLYTISKTWGRDIYCVFIGIMLAGVIRLLIGGVGVAIITVFTSVHRTWFVLFLGLYYVAFLAVDTWLALWILRNSKMKDGEQQIHGNLWDMFS